jgi:CBS domain-containing protein
MICKEMMTPSPACCKADDTVVTAAMMMKSGNYGAVPVVSDRTEMRVVGIVTDRDLARKVIAEQRDIYKTTVEDVMSTDLVTCRVEDDYEDVAKAMRKNQIRRLPVVDANNRLVGIVSTADVALHGDDDDVAKTLQGISSPEPLGGFDVGKAGLWLAGGLGLGAGLFLLMNQDKARRWADQVSDAVGDLPQRARDLGGQITDKANQVVSSVRDTVSGGSDEPSTRI